MNRFAQLTLALAATSALSIGAAHAGTVIYNTGNEATATLALGINDDGSLNITEGNITTSDATGIAYKFPDGSWRDATAPGCLCEGWGVSVNDSVSGFANVASDFGANNLSIDTPAAVSSSTVTTTTSLASLPGLVVTHVYQPASSSGALFEAVVTISNTTGQDLTDVKYVRVMDWDVPPTEFLEFVTIKGTGTTSFLERSHSNGFDTANPLGGDFALDPATEDTDFADNGAADHGAYFRFNFGDLAANATRTFSIYYGAAANEGDALAAIGAESIELYSLGQSSNENGGANDDGVTFIFGFKGVGGIAIEPDPNSQVPEPGMLALIGFGLAGIPLVRRRRAA